MQIKNENVIYMQIKNQKVLKKKTETKVATFFFSFWVNNDVAAEDVCFGLFALSLSSHINVRIFSFISL